MNLQDYSSIATKSDFQKKQISLKKIERLITTCFQWIPLSLGMKLRNFVYHYIFCQIGTSVQIEPNVNFTKPYLIKLGNKIYIRSGANLEAVGENSRLSIGNEIKLDRGVDIRSHDGGGNIEIGDRTRIGPYTCLSGRHIKIGKDCLIASHVGIYASNHIFTDSNLEINKQERSYQGITIEDDCWLGSGVKVVDGVTIGKGSVIGAGAVVTKDIPPYSIAVGVPAKVISKRD
ncbi:MAG: DapH/DapD/GlmU-related protein [Xenococcaceae cyanobacterium]